MRILGAKSYKFYEGHTQVIEFDKTYRVLCEAGTLELANAEVRVFPHRRDSELLLMAQGGQIEIVDLKVVGEFTLEPAFDIKVPLWKNDILGGLIEVEDRHVYTFCDGSKQEIQFGCSYRLLYKPTIDNPIEENSSYTKKDRSVIVFPYANSDTQLLFMSQWGDIEVVDLTNPELFTLELLDSESIQMLC